MEPMTRRPIVSRALLLQAGLRLAACACLVLPACSPNTGPDLDPVPIVPNSDGTVSTIAGTGDAGFGGDGGRAASALLQRPMDLALTADQELLVADFGNHRIRAVDLASGLIRTVAGTGQSAGPAALNGPSGVTALPGGGFLVAAWGEHRIYEYDAAGERSTVAGDGTALCDAGDPQAPPQQMPIAAPRSVKVMADGSRLVSEQACHRIRRITGESVRAYAGAGQPGYAGDGEPAAAALLQAAGVEGGPSLGISLSPEDPPDELFIADSANHVVRQVKVFTGRMETLAGTGEPGFADGPPDQAQFNNPTNVFSPRDHSVWVVDTGNHAIRYIDPLGTRVRTVIGTGEPGYNGDGLPPEQTQLNSPTAVWVTEDGEVFVADSGNHRIRLFMPSGPGLDLPP